MIFFIIPFLRAMILHFNQIVRLICLLRFQCYLKKGIIKKIIFGIIGILALFILITAVSLISLFRNSHVVSEGQPIEKHSEHISALLIVDIQEVITGESSVFPSLQENAVKLISEINHVVDSFQVHNHPVIYVRSEIANPFINLMNNTYAKGSDKVKYDSRLKVVSDMEVVKTGEDAFRKTNLDEILNQNKVSELYIVGLDAADCVHTTIQAALNRQYEVNIIKEAVISKTESKTDSMIMKFRELGVGIISIDSLCTSNLN
jgi:nicotinamidase-related amidase